MAGVLKLFVLEVHINNYPDTSEVQGPCVSALLALTGYPRRFSGNPLAVRILDRGPHFEYPCYIGRGCFYGQKGPWSTISSWMYATE